MVKVKWSVMSAAEISPSPETENRMRPGSRSNVTLFRSGRTVALMPALEKRSSLGRSWNSRDRTVSRTKSRPTPTAKSAPSGSRPGPTLSLAPGPGVRSVSVNRSMMEGRRASASSSKSKCRTSEGSETLNVAGSVSPRITFRTMLATASRWSSVTSVPAAGWNVTRGPLVRSSVMNVPTPPTSDLTSAVVTKRSPSRNSGSRPSVGSRTHARTRTLAVILGKENRVGGTKIPTTDRGSVSATSRTEPPGPDGDASPPW